MPFIAVSPPLCNTFPFRVTPPYTLSILYAPTMGSVKLRQSVGIPSARCQTKHNACQMTTPPAGSASPSDRPGRPYPASHCVSDDATVAYEWEHHSPADSPDQSSATGCRLPSPEATPAHSSGTSPTVTVPNQDPSLTRCETAHRCHGHDTVRLSLLAHRVMTSNTSLLLS